MVARDTVCATMKFNEGERSAWIIGCGRNLHMLSDNK